MCGTERAYGGQGSAGMPENFFLGLRSGSVYGCIAAVYGCDAAVYGCSTAGYGCIGVLSSDIHATQRSEQTRMAVSLNAVSCPGCDIGAVRTDIFAVQRGCLCR
eukprot:2385141-Rhodomonas_salina.2